MAPFRRWWRPQTPSKPSGNFWNVSKFQRLFSSLGPLEHTLVAARVPRLRRIRRTASDSFFFNWKLKPSTSQQKEHSVLEECSKIPKKRLKSGGFKRTDRISDQRPTITLAATETFKCSDGDSAASASGLIRTISAPADHPQRRRSIIIHSLNGSFS